MRFLITPLAYHSLLFDGHGKHFDLEFLDYINSEQTEWNVNIELPSGTSYGQVGDSTEKNSCFTIALAKAKHALVTKKRFMLTI
jgi:hypothetical protein